MLGQDHWAGKRHRCPGRTDRSPQPRGARTSWGIPGVAIFASEKAVYIWKGRVYTPAGGLQPALLLADDAFKHQVISGD